MQAQDSKGQHALGPVEQAQTLLGPQPQRLEAMLGQCLRRRADHTVHPHLALADQRQRQVSKLRQIARRPDRTLSRHHREQAEPQQIQQALDHDGTHPRETLREAPRPQQQHCPDMLIGQRVAERGGMAAEQFQLQFVGAFGIDPGRCQGAEPGGDPIDRPAFLYHPLHQAGGRSHLLHQAGVEGHRSAVLGHRHDLIDTKRLAVQHDRFGHLSPSRTSTENTGWLVDSNHLPDRPGIAP